MAHLSKLLQQVLEELGHNTSFKRGADTAEAHATKAGVDIKTSALLDHVKKYKDEINADIGKVIPTGKKKDSSTVEPKTPETKPVGIKGVEAKRFNVRLPNNKYKAVYLEPEFVTALSVINLLDQSAWLQKAVKDSADRNSAGAIRGAIVSELLTKWL